MHVRFISALLTIVVGCGAEATDPRQAEFRPAFSARAFAEGTIWTSLGGPNGSFSLAISGPVFDVDSDDEVMLLYMTSSLSARPGRGVEGLDIIPMGNKMARELGDEFHQISVYPARGMTWDLVRSSDDLEIVGGEIYWQ